MSDYYNRLVTFIIDICPRPQRRLLLTLAEQALTSTSKPFKIGDFLQSKKSYIDKLQRWRKIRDDQYDTICQTFGKSDVDSWDVSLLSVVLKEMFRVELKQEEHDALAEIRMLRNELQHKSSTINISAQEFQDVWTSLEEATLLLARSAFRELFSGQHFQNSIQIEINTAKSNTSPNITEFLASWDNELKKKISQLSKQVDLVGADSRFSRDVLTSVTVKQTTRSGIPCKRMRMHDNRLEKLKENFALSLNWFSSDSAISPDDVEKVTKFLKKRHWVIISCFDSLKAYACAIRVTKDMPYRQDYCLEVSDPSDWSLIGFEDAELVVFKYPFGKDSYDATKAMAMVSAMDSILQSAENGDGHNSIDVVIVSSRKMIDQCNRNHEHDILDSAIAVCPGTTEKEPIDLTGDRNRGRYTEPYDSVYRNISDMSQNYILDHKLKYTNNNILQQSILKLKNNGVLVICGPRGSGKSTLAVTLLKMYPEDNCLIMTEPDDLKYIRPAETTVVLLEDMAGCVQLNQAEADKFFRKFNLLNASVRNGDLKLIITMQKSVYDEWSKHMPEHSFLDSCVLLSDDTDIQINIKQEPMDVHDAVETDACKPTESVSPDMSQISPATTNRNVLSVKNEQTYTVRLPSDRLQCQPSALCTLPSGETLLTDHSNNSIKKLNQRYEVVNKRSLPSIPLGLCYIGSNVAVVSMITTIQFLNVTGNMSLRKSIDTKHSCFSIAGNSDKLYVADLEKIHVYSTGGSYECVIKTRPTSPISGIALSNDGSTLYVTKRLAITKFEWSGLLIMDTEGIVSSSLPLNNCDGVCTDRHGNVLVLSANGIVQVSPDGKCILGLLSDDDTLGEAFCFGKSSSVLIASHSTGNYITVFELTDNNA